MGDEAGEIEKALGAKRVPASRRSKIRRGHHISWLWSWARRTGFGPLAEASKCHATGEQNFIKSLIHFDKDNISDKVLKKIGAYCAQPDFQPDIIGRVSLAAKSLCMWVRAMEVGGDQNGWGPEGTVLDKLGGGRQRSEGRCLVGGWVMGDPGAWLSSHSCMGVCTEW